MLLPGPPRVPRGTPRGSPQVIPPGDPPTGSPRRSPRGIPPGDPPGDFPGDYPNENLHFHNYLIAYAHSAGPCCCPIVRWRAGFVGGQVRGAMCVMMRSLGATTVKTQTVFGWKPFELTAYSTSRPRPIQISCSVFVMRVLSHMYLIAYAHSAGPCYRDGVLLWLLLCLLVVLLPL